MWKRRMIPALLAGTMVFSVGTVTYADGDQVEVEEVPFTDIRGHWAQDFIVNMADNDIINGFEDATFRPDEEVTKLQALTIVMNLLDQKVKLETDGAAYIGEVPNWALESVNLAIYNNIVTWEDIKNYNQPASRMFIVELLVNALGADTDQANANKLTFNDIENLSGEEKAYLVIALENEFVQGYEDHSFRPSQSVTRAEMAVFANRLFDTMEEEIDFEEGFDRVEIVTGTISRIAADIKELTIGSATFGVADRYTVKINDRDARFEDLKTLMDVRVVIRNERIIEINAYAVEAEKDRRDIVSGEISSIDRANKKLKVGLKTFELLEDAKVEINGDVAGFTNLATEMKTVLVLLNDKVEAIYAFEVDEKAAIAFDIDKGTAYLKDQFEEAILTGGRVSNSTPDLKDGRLRVSINGERFKTIDLARINGRQNDGREVARELERAIETALDDVRVKVSYRNTGRFIFETYDSPINVVPMLEFEGDSNVLKALGINEDRVRGSLGEKVNAWTITVKNHAAKDQTFNIDIEVDEENIDETIPFSVEKGDTAKEIADTIAKQLLREANIRSNFRIVVDDDEVTLTPNKAWDVALEIDEK